MMLKNLFTHAKSFELTTPPRKELEKIRMGALLMYIYTSTSAVTSM
jgi:hypothetical protein